MECRGKEEEDVALKYREQDEEGGCRNDATKMHNEGRDSIPRNYQERKSAWRCGTKRKRDGMRFIMMTDLTRPLVP
jgi:hypothetical protein